jgi:regulatory protein
VSSELQQALDLAYRALGHRERTVAEMRAYLEGKGVEPEAIEQCIAELETGRFLDDARFAERFAEDKRELERWGSERIGGELARRGVPGDMIEAVLASQGRDDELAAALALLAKRVPEPPADDRGRNRAWQMLVRKGYEPELAYEAIRAHRQHGVA